VDHREIGMIMTSFADRSRFAEDVREIGEAGALFLPCGGTGNLFSGRIAVNAIDGHVTIGGYAFTPGQAVALGDLIREAIRVATVNMRGDLYAGIAQFYADRGNKLFVSPAEAIGDPRFDMTMPMGLGSQRRLVRAAAVLVPDPGVGVPHFHLHVHPGDFVPKRLTETWRDRPPLF
jgi:hypothetical protein